MPLHTPEDPEFAALEARHAWFDAVLQAECGEIEGDDDGAPDPLNWLKLLPAARSLDVFETECSLAWVAPGGRVCTVWDATGDEDDPLWAVFVVDDSGVRWLPEYSVLDPEADEAELDRVLATATRELPDRLAAGQFDRDLPPYVVPEWLSSPRERESPVED
ncbi:MAG: hypothetical protein ACKO5K_04350 [Armatimonadota bacterium]